MRAGPDSRRSLLSWDSLERSPSSTCPARVHSQEPKLPSAQRCHAPGPVPPSWFLATSTVFSAHRVAGLLRPAANHGVRRVSRWSSPVPGPARRRCRARDDRPVGPRDAVHTLRRLPLVSSRTVSRRPLPSCRYPLARWRADAEATALSGAPAARGRQGESQRRRSEERGTGTRDEEPDSVMLRSAEADPHVTEHEAPGARRSGAGGSCRASRPDAPPKRRIGARDRTTAGLAIPAALPDPRSASEDASRGAPRPRPRGCRSGLHSARRSEWSAGPSSPSQSGRLQGLSPLTSPLSGAVVADRSQLVPSMGFVPLQGPSRAAPVRPCQVGGRVPSRSSEALVPPPIAASRGRVEGPPASLLEFSRASRAEARVAWRQRGAEAEPRLPSPFQRRAAAPGGATSRSLPTEAGGVRGASARRSLSDA